MSGGHTGPCETCEYLKPLKPFIGNLENWCKQSAKLKKLKVKKKTCSKHKTKKEDWQK